MTPTSSPPSADVPNVSNALARFAPATPSLLADRALLRRIDTKFAHSSARVAAILERLTDDYAVLPAGDSLVARYETLYFDSPDFRCFTEHLRGRRPRYKVRMRHYLDRDVSYLEVKQKTNANRTVKWRRPIDFRSTTLTDEDRLFLEEHCPWAQGMQRALWTNFHRVTLVGLHTMERVTIDLDLSFERGQERAALDGGVIVEVKQDRFDSRSPILLALRANEVRPLSISKYCAAATLLVPGARSHRYRPRLRALRKARLA